jgi:hypothetical protein
MRLRLFPVNLQHGYVDIISVRSLVETPTELKITMKNDREIVFLTIANEAAGEWQINNRRYNAWLFEAERFKETIPAHTLDYVNGVDLSSPCCLNEDMSRHPTFEMALNQIVADINAVGDTN